jgi:adenylylsulfate kinase
LLILMAGLPGTGKTTIARELSSRLAGTVLSKDDIRHALFAPEDVEYSAAQDDFCMKIMLETAGYLFAKNPGRHVFLDGRPFSRRYQIDEVIKAAGRLNQTWQILECLCSEESARSRLEATSDPSHPARNRSFALYLEVKARFEPITLQKVVIDTDQSLEVCIEQALQAIR